jgi:hypothetical protein
MTNKDVQIIKEEILHYLCDDWNNHKRGKAHKENQAIFDRKDSKANFVGTDLEMVMDKVVTALYVCKDKVDIGYEAGYRQGYHQGFIDGKWNGEEEE